MSDNRLKTLADRIERLMDERDGIQSDIRDIYAEAKSAGYVPKVLRKAITRKRMDPSKRDEEDTILDLYEGALTPTMRKAVAMAARGASAREIETETGIDQATVARSVSLNKKSETAAYVSPTQAYIDSFAAPKPEDGDDGITESCGGGESRPVSGLSPEPNESVGLQGGDPAGAATSPHATEAGVAPGPHDAFYRELDRVYGPDDEAPATPSVGAVWTGTTSNKAPDPRPVGAVASESERVAPQTDLEMPKIPSFLDRRTAQGRGA